MHSFAALNSSSQLRTPPGGAVGCRIWMRIETMKFTRFECISREGGFLTMMTMMIHLAPCTMHAAWFPVGCRYTINASLPNAISQLLSLSRLSAFIEVRCVVRTRCTVHLIETNIKYIWRVVFRSNEAPWRVCFSFCCLFVRNLVLGCCCILAHTQPSSGREKKCWHF